MPSIDFANIKQEIINQSKRALKKNIPKSESVRKDIRDNLIQLFNRYTEHLAVSWNSLEAAQKSIAKQKFFYIRDKVIRSFQALDVKYKVPVTCIEKIDPLILEDDFSEDENLDSDMSAIDFFTLASKLVHNQFDGSPDNLRSFLDALELLNSISTGQTANAVHFVKTRLTGKARDLITNETTIEQIIEKLKAGIKGDNSRLLTAKILNFKQNSKDTAAYATEIENLAESLKRAYINEGVPYEVAGTYTTETVVRSLSQNANSEKARLIVEAGTFNTVQEVVTKLVNSATNNSVSNVFYSGQNFKRSNNWHNGRGQYQNFNPANRSQNYCHGRRGRSNRGRSNNTRYPHYSFNGRSRSIRFYESGRDSENQSDPQQVRLGETNL